MVWILVDPRALQAWASAEAAPQEEHAKELATAVAADAARAERHPFQTTDRAEYKRAMEGKNMAELTHKATVTTLPFDVIHATQKRVSHERLAGHLSGDLRRHTGRQSKSGALIDLPIAVKMGGKIYLQDGHTRLTAQFLQGARAARVRLIDLDGDQ